MTDIKNTFARLLSVLAVCIFLISSLPQTARAQQAASSPIPTMAYYYIWFENTSWNRAKTDYPLLGRYTSDDEAVMRQHIEWAKSAGLEGFIVSWKSTDLLNQRLDVLTDLAEEQNFQLQIIYQGLDFERNPLPVDIIASDLDYFIENFAQRKAFSLFSRPVVILSGTWEFTPQEVNELTQYRRQDLLILASERNLDGYNRLAHAVDGNAYYWSSVNPDTFPGYREKLVEMGAAVHQNGGLWIPPAAPGFDARLIGGTTVVERKDGDTFRVQINTALSSSPDILGIISWNEFSENSHIEPSEEIGARYLNILSEINHLPPPQIGEFDSSEPSLNFSEILPNSRLVAVGSISILIIAGFVIIARRRTSNHPAQQEQG